MGTFTGGLGSQLGIAAESTYGTAVTVTKFLEFSAGETMSLVRTKLSSQQLAAGRQFQSSARTIATTRMAAGAVSLEVPNQGFGSLLNLLHGETVSPSKESSTSVYKQVHNIGTTDPFKKSITLQLGKPSIEGVVEPFTYPGTVATSMDLQTAIDGFLTAALTFDSNDELTGTSLASASYPSGLESFPFTKLAVKINSAEQKFVTGATLKIDTPKAINRFFMGAEKKAVPLTNAYGAASGTITVEYKDNTLYKLFEEGKTVPIEFTWTGATVETIVTELKIKLAACKLEGDTPNIANVGALVQTIGFKVEDNRSEAPIIATYVSKDSTL